MRRVDLLVGGVAVAGGIAATGAATGSPASPRAAGGDQDRAALELILLVERTEQAFYREAIARGALSGELLRFARAVAEQETEHVTYVEQALGGRDRPRPRFDFGFATGDPDGFASAAAKLEDLAVGAYNGQATNVSRQTLAAAARILSVEARHAAWIRSISGDPPAPDATDRPLSSNEVLDGLRGFGLKR